jgi:prefoldin subunit 5
MIEKLSKNNDLSYAYNNLGAAVGILTRKIDEIIDHLRDMEKTIEIMEDRISWHS